MEAHIKGHANEMPDDEENSRGTAESTTGNEAVKKEKPVPMDVSSSPGTSPTSTMPTSSLSSVSPPNGKASMLPATPRESSSDAEEVTYYNMYSRYEQQSMSNQHYTVPSNGGVNPALLAAVSIAASANDSDDLTTLGRNMQREHSSAIPSTSSGSGRIGEQDVYMDNSFIYEPLAVMRQQGFFNPAPKVEEFK